MVSVKTSRVARRWRKDVPDKYIFFAPTITLILLMAIFPLFFSLTLTFTSWHLATGNLSFIGCENYVRMVKYPLFWNSIKNTLIYVILGVGLQYVLGYGLALLMNQNIRGKKIFRVVFLIPMMLTPVAVGYLFKMLYNENIGPLNDIITSLGLPALHFVTNAKWAIYFLILTDTWQWTPFMFILLLAGLQSLPDEPYEAAIVDGASNWQLFTYITFPLMLPVSFTALLIRSLEIFKMIDIINVITGGGPGVSTETSTVYAYLVGLRAFDLGYGATIAWFLLITVIIFTMLSSRIFKRLAPETAGL